MIRKTLNRYSPFGYGLSYTNFEYSNLSISKKEIQDVETVTVSVNVKNTGVVAGKEIAFYYANSCHNVD